MNYHYFLSILKTELQDVVQEETKIHLEYYLRDTFLHFGETWENIQVSNKIAMGA